MYVYCCFWFYFSICSVGSKEVQELQVHDLSDQLSVVSKNRDSALTDVNVLVSEKCGLEVCGIVLISLWMW